MSAKFNFSLHRSAWLLALLIITSALPAHAQNELDAPFHYELTEDGSGYIISPIKDLRYDNVLFVPATRVSDGLPIVGIKGFSYNDYILAIEFEEGSNLKYIGPGCFQGCTGIQVIISLPESVESFGDYAFSGCSMLEDVPLNSNLKYIGISCFEGCTSIRSIKLPKSLETVREAAFKDCTALESVEFEDRINCYTDSGFFGIWVFAGCTNLHSVKLPNNAPGKIRIPECTFCWCPNLKSIVFPANTYNIGYMAFCYSGLKSLDFTTITLDEFFLDGYYTFSNCDSLKSVKANSNLRFASTGLYNFQTCKALETFTISGSGDDYTIFQPDVFRFCDNLKSVKVHRLKGTGANNEMDSVFYGCKNLKEVISTCPPVLSKIGFACFEGCESLERIDLPVDNPFVVSGTAFSGCASLQNINLANVTSIGTKAFAGCNALASISIKSATNNPPSVESKDAFDEGHYNNTLIEVLDEKYSDFASDAFWSKFRKIKHPSIFAYSDVPGGYAVSKSPYALEEDIPEMLDIPEQCDSVPVVAIPENGFRDLTMLTGITLPEGLTSIGSNAFAGCTNIRTVNNKTAEPLYGDNCPNNAFDNEIYQGYLYVPFGSYDAYRSFAPWESFSDRIKEGFGERNLLAPEASRNSGEFNLPFELTLTNRNTDGDIYYYITTPNEAGGYEGINEVHQTYRYTAPILINKSCKVCAYVTNGTNCCDPTSLEFTLNPLSTEVGLDKVLSANPGEAYLIVPNLYGHYHDGTYLYASTELNTGSSKNTFNEDKKSAELSDKESNFHQDDWVAISGLSADYVGKELETANHVANVVANTEYPVISFDQEVGQTEHNVAAINTFRVENFNIHADNAAVSNIWLVAPQPAEYCAVGGNVNVENIHPSEGYLVLQSADMATTADNETAIEPLTMKVYFNPATFTFGVDGWYSFTGIVKREGNGLAFTLQEVTEAPSTTSIDEIDGGGARIFAGNGNIHVAADALTSITVYSTTGQIVTSIEASSATIAVTPGFYIVKVGNRVTKLAVK